MNPRLAAMIFTLVDDDLLSIGVGVPDSPGDSQMSLTNDIRVSVRIGL